MQITLGQLRSLVRSTLSERRRHHRSHSSHGRGGYSAGDLFSWGLFGGSKDYGGSEPGSYSRGGSWDMYGGYGDYGYGAYAAGHHYHDPRTDPDVPEFMRPSGGVGADTHSHDFADFDDDSDGFE